MMERWSQHLYDAFSTNKDSSFKSRVKFHKAIRKYGVDTWLHVELYSGTGSNMSLQDLEVYYIEKHNTYHKGYNSTLGGDGVDSKSVRKSMVDNRKSSVKGYSWNEGKQSYKVILSYMGKKLSFGYYKFEDDAKLYADYLMLMSDDELVKTHEQYKASKKGRTKGYSWSKTKGKYLVSLTIDGKHKSFGYYLTEQEAKDRVTEVRSENKI